MTSRVLRYVVLLSAIGLVFAAGSVVHAQTGVVSACLNPSSGTVRIIASDAQCRDTETALSWNAVGQQGPPGPEGPPGPQNLVAIAVNGLNQTKSTDIPNVGTLAVTCDAAGQASMVLTSAHDLQYRSDVTTTDGNNQTAAGSSSGVSLPFTFIGGANPFGLSVRLVVTREGIGVWKVDGTVRSRYVSGPSNAVNVCFAIASVTTPQ